ncbi:MAG: peptide-N4-asparagine amidase [Candidatus Acidiferrum sp.]
MHRFPLSFPIHLVRLTLALALLFSLSCFAEAQNPGRVIGSQNTVTADPPVARPHGTPCVVPLFSGFQFVDFSIQTYQFTPPASCPGPWEKIVFTADFNVTAGRQFDRTAIINLGNVNIYFGTTPEPRHNLSPSWHVERDETDYAALFLSPQSGHVILGNVVNSTYTGVISGSAQLEFYPAKGNDAGQGGQRAADVVLPLVQSNGQGGTNEPAFLFTSADQLATTFTLPLNIERAYLDVITQSQIGDEFWYACVPNDAASELQSCGGTAFREAEVSIDGQPAGVAPVYPWIYTGGVDPFLWEPIPGVQALDFVPYRVDLTPFAGVLSNGQPHSISLSVYNANSYFSATATLLLFEDHNSQQVTGAVTANTISGAPTPSISENLKTDASGNITGTVRTASSREFIVAGYVKTSHGTVHTEVHQSVGFKNRQNFTITAAQYVQDISQDSEVDSETFTRSGFGSFVTEEAFHYPLTMNIALNFAPDGSFDQVTTVSQGFRLNVHSPYFASIVDNLVNSTDTLNFNSSGAFSGNVGAKSSQRYNAFNTRGENYSCNLLSENNVLTSVSEGCADSAK